MVQKKACHCFSPWSLPTGWNGVGIQLGTQPKGLQVVAPQRPHHVGCWWMCHSHAVIYCNNIIKQTGLWSLLNQQKWGTQLITPGVRLITIVYNCTLYTRNWTHKSSPMLGGYHPPVTYQHHLCLGNQWHCQIWIRFGWICWASYIWNRQCHISISLHIYIYTHMYIVYIYICIYIYIYVYVLCIYVYVYR